MTHAAFSCDRQRTLLPSDPTFGPLSLIRGICDQLGIASVINGMVAWDPVRAKLSPGDLICALIICCFFRQHPLYKVGIAFDRSSAGEIGLERINSKYTGK